MLTNNMKDGLMFHTCFNVPLEWVTARDSGLLIKNIIKRDYEENGVKNFWKRCFNIGGGARNRVVMAPMLIGMGDFDGKPTEQLMNYYVERAKGGTALIITEITRVNDFHGAAAFAQLSMSKDSHIEPMRKFADRIHEAGGINKEGGEPHGNGK